MDGTVEAGTEEVRHAAVELQEGVGAGLDDVLDLADDAPGVGYEEGAGLDLKLYGATVLRA